MNWYKRIVLAIKGIAKKTYKKVLKDCGVVFKRPGDGSHSIYWNPITGNSTSIPFADRASTISPGTFEQNLRELDISKEEFNNRLFQRRNKKIKTSPIIKEEPQIEIKEKEIPSWQNSEWYHQQQQQSI